MAFLDELGDSLGRLGKTVAGRAKNAAETGNLKIQIANAQKEVTKAYTELGKKFAELNQDTMDEALKPLLEGWASGAEKKGLPGNEAVAFLREQIAAAQKAAKEKEN